MRTTLAIDDDVLSAAQEMARMEHKTVGEVISTLARKALVPAGTTTKSRNGVPLLKPRKDGTRVTTELVNRLREELP